MEIASKIKSEVGVTEADTSKGDTTITTPDTTKSTPPSLTPQRPSYKGKEEERREGCGTGGPLQDAKVTACLC